MKLHKRLLRNEVVRGVLCAAAAWYIRLVWATGRRWRVEGGDVPAAVWREGRPFIIAFWHGRLLMMPYCWNNSAAVNMLISEHPDGQFIARTIGHFGFGTVAGSTRRGGASALRAMLRALKSGDCVGITPDGPRGPRMRAGGTIVEVARLARAPVVPVAFATSRRRVLGTWDRFVVALPLSRGVFVWGQPISVAADAAAETREAARRALEDALNAVTREADRLVGQPAIEPAAEAAPAGSGVS